jgi:hypothetical protein
MSLEHLLVLVNDLANEIKKPRFKDAPVLRKGMSVAD